MSERKSIHHIEPKKIFAGVNYLSPEARELVKTLEGRQLSELSDDEIILLAVTVAQAALAKYVEPGDRSCEHTIETILGILDHQEVVQATLNKLRRTLRSKRHKKIGADPRIPLG
jgi:hypothetical protein